MGASSLSTTSPPPVNKRIVGDVAAAARVPTIGRETEDAGVADGEGWEEPLSAAEMEAAVARVRAAAEALPAVEDRRVPLSDLLQVHVPELRNPTTGRLDAKQIAEALGISLRKLAGATPVTPQALSETPDSPRAQAALDPFARVLGALREMVTPEQQAAWLNTPHPRWQNRTPLAAMLAGEAEAVARAVEIVRDGGLGR